MEEILSSEMNDSEKESELSLRPTKLDEYIGQEQLKFNLKVFIGAAKNRNEVLDHILLYGPQGLGKTTLANIVANEMGTKLHIASGPALEKTGDIAILLSDLQPGDILFIDEIHRIPKIIEESLYTALEDFQFTIVLNRETNAKAITIDLPPFTLIGATTNIGSLSSPLRNRFGIVEKLSYYTEQEIQSIISRTAKVFKNTIDLAAAYEIAKRSRGTPRIANRLFKRVRDFANYANKTNITLDDTLHALNSLRVDDIGLGDVDVKYLTILIKRFNGGPVGLSTLADAIGEDENNLDSVYEPYLLKQELIDRTLKGRIATRKAYQHLGFKNRISSKNAHTRAINN